MKSQLGIGILNGAMAGAMWGLVFIAPVLLHGCTPLQICIGRFLVYGLISTVMLWPQRRDLLPRLGAAEWRGLLWLSLTGNMIYFIGVVMAVEWAGGAATSLIVGMVPVVVAVASCRSPGATPLRQLLPALLLSVLGVGLIAAQSLQHEVAAHGWWTRILGLLSAFLALLSWSGYSMGNSHWLRRRNDLSSQQWALLTGVVTGLETLCLIPVLWLQQGAEAWSPVTGWPLFLMVSTATAVLASLVGNICWNRASQRLPLPLSGQMVVFETLFALLYTFIWQHRGPSLLEVLAVICLLAGVVLAAKAHARGAHSASALGSS